MVAHRVLDRDSSSFDSNQHLAAITSFARNAAPATLAADVGTEFTRQAACLVPALSAFKRGSREGAVVDELREHLPKVRDALRQVLGDLDVAYTRGFQRGGGSERMDWLVVGVHIEGVIFALFPERWNAMNAGPGVWDDPAVLSNNVHWALEGLQRAGILYDTWRDALSTVHGVQ